MTRLLITGGSGQVGRELLQYPWNSEMHILAPDRSELDMSDPAMISDYVGKGGFSAVINAAAYTAVDKAETDVVSAWCVNALGPAALAQATRAASIPLIQLSTDYVFDGGKAAPYCEGDAIGPLNVYGASKEAGEQAVRTGNSKHCILRTAWVFSRHGTNFVKTMLRLAQDRPELRIVHDQQGCPTSAQDIAGALARIVDRLLSTNPPYGTYHFVNRGETTWAGFAGEIFAQAKASGCPVPRITGIPSSQYPVPAARPHNSRLSTAALERDFGITPRPWQDALADVLRSINDISEGRER
ncbi:dTDP-4-dehydrorhamnose reductase [Shinella sp. DD12]|uniref:dTDP-4-dehydrorhamnose reductase n=1 Tax=Shinella sp. DD12 TaxID=1410620 RepID=UPI0003C551E9|nr:dTDP-4-dehydrorhamnose reductase [Shinella sp. DD12]EYR80471.1 putative dTDP-4-dehydrorhamnose reductase [Shinella sp. DD12]